MHFPPLPRRHAIPALRLAIPYACGIVTAHHAPVSLLAAGTMVVGLATLVCILIRRRSLSTPLGVGLPVLLMAALGALKLSSDRSTSPGLRDSTGYAPSTVIGMIADPVMLREGRARFTLRSAGYEQGGRRFPFDALVAVTLVLKRTDTAAHAPDYGSTVLLTGYLSPPTPERNPGEFSPEMYYDAAGVTGTLFVRGMTNIRILDSSGGAWPMKLLIVPARRWILRLIDETVGGEEGEFLKGLLIGERSGIPSETKQAFVDSGVAHVLAVSGSNVAVVALILMFLYDLVRLPRRWRALVVAAGLLWYMFLTGTQPPVVRATVMALVLLAGNVAGRQTNGHNALGVAGLVILLFDARQLFDVGFQLSFGAVLAIIHLSPRADALIGCVPRQRAWQRASVPLLRLCAVSLAATLGTLPLTAIAFGRVSLVGILANLPVVPATGVSVILGAAAMVMGVVSPTAAQACGAVNSLVLHGTLAVAKFSASLPFAFVETYRVSWPHAWIFFLVLTLIVHWPEKKVVRGTILLLLVSANLFNAALLFAPVTTNGGELRVHFIDVGQGDAILVEFPGGGTALIDGGPRSRSFDAGAMTVGPYLKRKGITRIDLLLATHPHDDHIGGIPSILRQFEVRRMLESGQPLKSETVVSYLTAAAEGRLERRAGTMGEMVKDIPSIRMYILAPGRGFVDPDTTHRPPNLNNTSLAVKLEYGATSFLFAGDAEDEAEEAMVERYGDFLASTVLKSAHHGSITSSSPRFLAAVRPSMIVVSVGRYNKFRHPSPEVIARYQDMHAEVFRTDREGAVVLVSNGEKVTRMDWR